MIKRKSSDISDGLHFVHENLIQIAVLVLGPESSLVRKNSNHSYQFVPFAAVRKRKKETNPIDPADSSPSSYAGLMNDWEIAGNKNPWVCPSDRHLALRAQLKAGWSVHTQKGTTSSAIATKSQPAGDKISDAERAQIADVLARADRTKGLEGERVGKLIERLENMRRRATGNGVTQCMLCGAEFGLLGSRSYGAMCHDCRKYVCQKNCGVETYDQERRELIFLCKICSEYREMWKKSGAWFYNRMPDAPPIRSPVDRPYRATPERSPLRSRASGSGRDRYSSEEEDDYRRMSTHGRRLPPTKYPHDNKQDQSRNRSGSYRRLLPQVPTEERRKSPLMKPRWALEARSISYGTEGGDSSTSEEEGVYQRRKLKTLPPTPNTMPQSSMQRIAVGRRHKLTDTDSEQEPDDSGSPTPPSSPRYSLPTPSSHGEPEIHNQTMTGDVSDSKSIDSGVVQSDNSQSLIRPSSLQPVMASPAHSFGNQKAEPFVVSMTESADRNQTPSVHTTANQVKSLSSEPKVSTTSTEDMAFSSSFKRQLYLGHSQDTSDPETSAAIARKSSVRTLESMTDIPSSPDDDLTKAREHSTSTTLLSSALRSSAMSKNSLGAKHRDDNIGTLGTIEFALLYNPNDQTLNVNLIKAKNLRAMDSNGFSDPFVKLNLLPGADKATKMRTKTIFKSLNPQWQELLTYHGVTEDDRLKKTLRITVLDEDRIGSDFLGETRVPLKKLSGNKERKFNVYLEKQMPVETLSRTSDTSVSEERGKILLSLMYNTQANALAVGVIRCAELLGCDTSGYSDPYVRLSLTPLSSKKHKSKTSVKKRNCNPEFNQEFAFSIPLKDLPKKTLELKVYDKDKFKGDDFIGGLSLGSDSKGERLRHWTKCLQSPGQKFQTWHKLLPDPQPSAK